MGCSCFSVLSAPRLTICPSVLESFPTQQLTSWLLPSFTSLTEALSPSFPSLSLSVFGFSPFWLLWFIRWAELRPFFCFQCCSRSVDRLTLPYQYILFTVVALWKMGWMRTHGPVCFSSPCASKNKGTPPPPNLQQLQNPHENLLKVVMWL